MHVIVFTVWLKEGMGSVIINKGSESGVKMYVMYCCGVRKEKGPLIPSCTSNTTNTNLNP